MVVSCSARCCTWARSTRGLAQDHRSARRRQASSGCAVPRGFDVRGRCKRGGRAAERAGSGAPAPVGCLLAVVRAVAAARSGQRLEVAFAALAPRHTVAAGVANAGGLPPSIRAPNGGCTATGSMSARWAIFSMPTSRWPRKTRCTGVWTSS